MCYPLILAFRHIYRAPIMCQALFTALGVQQEKKIPALPYPSGLFLKKQLKNLYRQAKVPEYPKQF